MDALNYIHQLENQLADAGKKVEQLKAAQPKWISVEERLPEYWVSVLAFRKHRDTPDDGYHNTCIIMRTEKYGMEERPDYYEVTHWMPLPQPPKE